jgi:hypothetical protein
MQVHYMEKVTCNRWIGLSVKLFKGNTLAYLTCTSRRELCQLEVLNHFIIDLQRLIVHATGGLFIYFCV